LSCSLAVRPEEFLLVQDRRLHLFNVAQALRPSAPAQADDATHDFRESLDEQE
jgi:hypothetical protein